MKKAQAALEFLIIIAFGLAILSVSLITAFDYTTGYKEVMDIKKADNSAEKILWASKLVYSQGEGAKTKIILNLPDLEKSSYIYEKEISLEIPSTSGLTEVIKSWDIENAKMKGSVPLEEGSYNAFIFLKENDIILQLDLPVSLINVTSSKSCAGPPDIKTGSYKIEFYNISLQPTLSNGIDFYILNEDRSIYQQYSNDTISSDYSGTFTFTPNIGTLIITAIDKNYKISGATIFNTTC